jgi:hypothetical protein
MALRLARPARLARLVEPDLRGSAVHVRRARATPRNEFASRVSDFPARAGISRACGPRRSSRPSGAGRGCDRRKSSSTQTECSAEERRSARRALRCTSLPCLVHGADAERRLAPVGVDHCGGTAGPRGSALPRSACMSAVPMVHRHRDALRRVEPRALDCPEARARCPARPSSMWPVLSSSTLHEHRSRRRLRASLAESASGFSSSRTSLKYGSQQKRKE